MSSVDLSESLAVIAHQVELPPTCFSLGLEELTIPGHGKSPPDWERRDIVLLVDTGKPILVIQGCPGDAAVARGVGRDGAACDDGDFLSVGDPRHERLCFVVRILILAKMEVSRGKER